MLLAQLPLLLFISFGYHAILFKKYLIVFLMRPQEKRKFILILGGIVLVVAIIGGVIGNRTGKDDCQCITKPDSGWMGFSITYFALTVVGVAVLIFMLQRKISKFSGDIFQGGLTNPMFAT